ncbi:ABC transporter substrate-binding protein [Streptomyces sp. PT12]|uniref:ABC transporter substrate-binding protein n=1 Tax=Streptomyces sp. PT12 TaxID=1510197 RepID=UPI000DE3385D|nr:ABC transporter substrate-binding protein [Streptomyces sp. PT12]RBM22999.1 hypothetical protein DEH69_03535 [Streptomyces sp. PT12]
MKRILRLGCAAALLTALAATTACGGNDEGGEGSGDGGTASFEFAIASAVIGPKEEVATYAVGQEQGFLDEERIEISASNADGSVAALQAVASGSADITAADAGAILAARENGVPVKAIGGLVQNWPWVMAVPPESDIASAADIEGKRIGVISLASGSAMYARSFVANAGLDPERDVELLPVGVGAQAATALADGQVDVLALYTQAYTTIENTGTTYRYLDNPEEFDGIRSITFAVREDALESRRDELVRFLRASYRSMLFSAVNPEAAVRDGYAVFPQMLAGADPDARIEDDTRTFATWMASATPATGEPEDFADWGAISEEEWTKTVAFARESGQISEDVEIDDVWDGSLLDEANDFDPAAVVTLARESAG